MDVNEYGVEIVSSTKNFVFKKKLEGENTW